MILRRPFAKPGFSCTLLLVGYLSCTTTKQSSSPVNKPIQENQTLLHARSFENLVMVDSLGVTGADGVISFPLTDSTSVFMMGDSFLSPVVNNKRDVNSKMINNTLILINHQAREHKALYAGTEDNPDAFLKPGYGNPKEYYWPGHGFESHGIIHLFMSRFIHGDFAWGFQFSGTDYIRLRKEDFAMLSQEDFPYSMQNDVHYGHSILKDNPYVYLYGASTRDGISSLHVARATLNKREKSLDTFTFYDGRDWVSNPMESASLTGVKQSVPEQFSVFRHRGKYILIMMARDLAGGAIYSYLSDKPTGPWYHEKLLYRTTEQHNTEDQVFTYNAMAHPQYIKNNSLLVSYCINSFDVRKIHEVNTDYYRPKFLWVPLEMIME